MNTLDSFKLSTKNNDLKLKCISSMDSPKRHIFYIKENVMNLELI